jgi:hypothetical protein
MKSLTEGRVAGKLMNWFNGVQFCSVRFELLLWGKAEIGCRLREITGKKG